MAESYEEIVRKYYREMKPRFIDSLMERYKQSKLRHEDAENIYQDIFLAIHENLLLGRIKENTSWSSYIMTVGLNMASKQYRRLGKIDSADKQYAESEERQSKIAREVEEKIRELSSDDPGIYNNPEVQEILGEELAHTPDPCATIIRYTYLNGMSDAEIVEEYDRYNSTKSVKAKRWQCMKDFIYRVKMALYNAGIIDEKPVKN